MDRPRFSLKRIKWNQGESRIRFSSEENKFGRVGITEESAVLASRRLFKSASPRVDERGCAPTKYRHNGGIALEQQRGIKTVGREPSWCRPNSEYHKALAPFFIPI